MRKRRESVTSIVTFQNNRFLKYIENKPNRTRHFRFHFNLKDSNYENTVLYNAEPIDFFKLFS